MGNKITLGFWSGVIILTIWYLSLSNEKPSPEYIRQEFKNGKVIELPVDDSIRKNNWECTDDCSGHGAGYDWAEKQGISDPSDCTGKSESFIEGCEAYANENNQNDE